MYSHYKWLMTIFIYTTYNYMPLKINHSVSNMSLLLSSFDKVQCVFSCLNLTTNVQALVSITLMLQQNYMLKPMGGKLSIYVELVCWNCIGAHISTWKLVLKWALPTFFCKSWYCNTAGQLQYNEKVCSPIIQLHRPESKGRGVYKQWNGNI